MQIVDLSQDIYEGMKVYPGHLKTVQFEHSTHEETQPRFDSGFSFQTTGFILNDNGPTHVDSFSHLDPDPGAQTIEQMPLDLFYGTAVCLDVTGFPPRTDITAEDLDRVEASSPVDVRPGDIVLFHTGTWNRFAGDKRYLSDFPGLGESGSEWIVRRQVKTFGVDSPTPDNPASTSYPCHMMCRREHITHYEKKAESSGFLKVRREVAGRELAELSAAAAGGMFVSDGPVELRLGNGELPGVGLCLCPASVVAARVTEDPARKHHECFAGRAKVGIPGHGLVVQNTGEDLGKVVGVGLVCFKVEQGPDLWLPGRGVILPVPADLADGQLEVLQIRSDAEALRDKSALDHDDLLAARVCSLAARACSVSACWSGATVAAAIGKPRVRAEYAQGRRGTAGPQVTDRSRRCAAPRLQESRTRFTIADGCIGMPMRIQEAAKDTSALPRCHLTCDKGRPAPKRAETNCRQIQHLANLDQVVNTRFTFAGFPLKLRGAHGGPTRAVALVG